MKSYYAYIRVSTVRQGEYGSSLQEQKSAIEAYAAKYGLRIAEWFEETETAAKQGRREFSRLTTLLRNGKASGVIIHKIDRSARNLKDWASLGELIDSGIEVLFAHEGLDMQTRGGRLAADVQAVVAADFVRNLRQEVRKGFYGRLKQGFYPLPAPRGYLDRGKAQVKEICPVAGPLVRLAFELYGTGTYSLETLRHELARHGLLSGNGKPLALDAMSLLLHNTFYIGLIHIRRTDETFEGNHTPLVSKALFDRVKAILAGKLYARVERHAFLFRRLVVCVACGRSLSGERQKGRIYYRCHERTCRRVSVSEVMLDDYVASSLQSLVLDAQDVGDFRDLLRKRIATERSQEGNRRAFLERDYAMMEQRLSKLTDVLIDGNIDKPAYEQKRAELLARKCELRDAMANDDDMTFWDNVSEKFERGLTAYTGYISGTDDEKRRMVKLVSSNLTIDGKQPVLSLLFPFKEISDWSISTSCGPCSGAIRTSRSFAGRKRRKDIFRLLQALERNNVSDDIKKAA